MFLKLAKLISLLIITSLLAAEENHSFIYNGFRSAKLILDAVGQLTSNGLLKLTNETKRQSGHAFYPQPIPFKNRSPNGAALSFSTTFVFGILSQYGSTLSGHGIAFVVAPTKGLPGALPSQYLCLFNKTTNGNTSNHVFTVELDTIESNEFSDINDNHVGIDINDLKSEKSEPVGYYDNQKGGFINLTLISGHPMQVWVEYDGLEKRINVTLAPINVAKPRFPLLSTSRDLSSVVNHIMYVGFSSSTGSVLVSHYVLGWSFSMNGHAEALILSQLPKLRVMCSFF